MSIKKSPGKDGTGAKGFHEFRDKLVNEGRLKISRNAKLTKNKTVNRSYSDKPNVLWIMCDQLRADTLGFAGHPFVKTPNMDRIANEGAAFNRSYCSSPVCMPSRATFLTGQYCNTHGVIQNEIDLKNPDAILLTDILKNAGYRTANIGKTHCGRKPNDVFEWHENVNDAFGATAPSLVPFNKTNFSDGVMVGNIETNDPNKLLYATYPAGEEITKSYLLATQAEKWLYWNDDPRPFFLRVSFDDPHSPIVPPEPYASMYKPEDIPEDLLTACNLESMINKPKVVQDFWRYCDYDKITEKEHRKHAAMYLGFVTHVDAQIGRILDYLNEVGYTDNTIVILNSDHGHMIGEHNLAVKGTMLFEGVTRIPTAIKYPNIIKPNTKVDAIVEGVDFAPTILDMLGVDIPNDMQGESMFPLAKGEECKEKEYAFIQWDDYGYAIVGKKWKLIYWDCDNDGELYDLENDKYEINNLFNKEEYKEIQHKLLNKLNEWRK